MLEDRLSLVNEVEVVILLDLGNQKYHKYLQPPVNNNTLSNLRITHRRWVDAPVLAACKRLDERHYPKAPVPAFQHHPPILPQARHHQLHF
jgi:hypothetical protein